MKNKRMIAAGSIGPNVQPGIFFLSNARCCDCRQRIPAADLDGLHAINRASLYIDLRCPGCRDEEKQGATRETAGQLLRESA